MGPVVEGMECKNGEQENEEMGGREGGRRGVSSKSGRVGRRESEKRAEKVRKLLTDWWQRDFGLSRCQDSGDEVRAGSCSGSVQHWNSGEFESTLLPLLPSFPSVIYFPS